MKNTKEAFHWIVDVLRKYNVPFQVTGGLAAKAYGSGRPLNDIDIDIPDSLFSRVLPDIKPYLEYGPDRYVDERWDLLLATLNYKGQEIDISGGTYLRICDARTGIWHDCQTDFEKSVEREIFGLWVPVISREDLIEYKKMLIGEHQKKDIEAISRQ